MQQESHNKNLRLPRFPNRRFSNCKWQEIFQKVSAVQQESQMAKKVILQMRWICYSLILLRFVMFELAVVKQISLSFGK